MVGRGHVRVLGRAMKRAATPTAAEESEAAEPGRDAVDRAVAAVDGHVPAVNPEAGPAQDLRVPGRTEEAEEREGRASAARSADHGPGPPALSTRSRAPSYWGGEGRPV
ncbi:hypothetical protein ACIPPJ_22440 [Streptomyces sp. NPDC086091]|uniref:hypothetical protein n=1 Tax=Streptomyces sp. NPDC086091 TaxID=3365751 RepID=UPI00380841C9